MPNLYGRAYKKLGDDEATCIQGVLAEAWLTQGKPPMASLQASDCLNHDKPESCIGYEEEEFFQQQVKDVHCAKEVGKAAANIVQGFSSNRYTVMLWLQRTSIKDCLEGLDKEQI
jgi:hypothetical protein